MTWRPIETAPKGETRLVKVGNKGGEREVLVPAWVLVPTSDGKITMSHWLPQQGRWNMFSTDYPPTHWWDFGDGQAMPSPPEAP